MFVPTLWLSDITFIILVDYSSNSLSAVDLCLDRKHQLPTANFDQVRPVTIPGNN